MGKLELTEACDRGAIPYLERKGIPQSWGIITKAAGLFCLFGVLRRFQHCTGHITTGSWKGRGNQYI